MCKVSCVIITYNIGEEIVDNYKSIKQQVNEVIFVDNNSNEVTKKILNDIIKENSNTKLISNSDNFGIAKALNLGIEEAMKSKPKFILTLDHDSVMQNDGIEKMINIYKEMSSKYKIGILSPTIYDINKGEYLTSTNDEDYQIAKVCIQSGALLNVDLLNDIGFYNEELFIYYVDTELCYRATRNSYVFIQCNEVKLLHEEGKKSRHFILGKEFYYLNYNEFAIYYRARNYIYMLKNYFSEFNYEDKMLIAKDLIKIILFDRNKIRSAKAHLKGIVHGVRKYYFK